MKTADFAIVGLGRIGGNLARQAMEKGWIVAGHSRGGVPDALRNEGLLPVKRLSDLARRLTKPRIVLLYVPAGHAVDELLETLASSLEPGDIVADGGNSYWGDSIRRANRLRERELWLVDVGTSGGVEGARHGACFMAGGDAEATDPARACRRWRLRAHGPDRHRPFHETRPQRHRVRHAAGYR